MSPHRSPHPAQANDNLNTNAGGRGLLARRPWRRAVMALALTIVAAALPFPSMPAHAVHDLGLFELDANAVDDGMVAGDDWDTLVGGGGGAFAFSGVIADTFGQAEASSFFGGGSKDDNFISTGDNPNQLWQHASASVQTKADLTNAYAAAYLDPVSEDVILYYGADRFDADGGATTLGFWFFQDEIGLNPGDPGPFSGEHVVGDILVVADFTNGGMTVTIDVYRWDGTQPVIVLEDAVANCATVPAGDDVCAIVNTDAAGTPAPWPYTNLQAPPGPPTGGPSTTFPQFAFFEGGINLSEIFRIFDGGGVPCFSSFLAETRSSPSIESTLQDFVLGGFDLCDLDVEKTGDALAKIGDPVDYTVTITNSGLVDLFVDDITDSLIGDIVIDGVDQNNPAVTSNDCPLPVDGPLAAGESCTIELTRTVLETDPDPLINTVTVTFNTGDPNNGGGVSFTRTDQFPTNLFDPEVSVTKTGDELSTVGDEVDYVITVTNTSSVDSPPLVDGTIVDSLLGDLLAVDNPFVTSSDCTATLAVGTSCTINATRTVLEGDPDPLPNTVTVSYNPERFPNVIRAQDDHDVNLFQPSVAVVKEGAELSKVGATVTYTITITSTSSPDTPTLVLDSINDTLIGDLTIPAECDALEPGESCEFTADRVVEAGDPNPVVNTVTVIFHADGFDAAVATATATDDHATDLFVPSVTVSKGGPAEAQVGDTVTYTFTVTNTSTANSPDLILDSIEDPLIGALTIPAACNVLEPGESCNFTADRVVLAGDPDPVVNTVTVHYHPEGFPNDVADTDPHTVDIVSPYGDYPGDDDFDFDTPFDDAGDPGTPAPTTDTAGNNDQTGTQVPAAPGSGNQDVVANNVTTAGPDPAAPVALDQLPRTGVGIERLTMLGGLLMIIGGLAAITSRRRREHTKA